MALTTMLVLGVWDDIKNLSAVLRLFLQFGIVGAYIAFSGIYIHSFHGLSGIHEISPWLSIPLSLVTGVGIINAINMIDGIDGLSSGICILAFGFYGILFFYSHDFVRAALAASIIGGLIPFFIMNVFGNRSKMFIGDAGTMMLGIALCDMVMAMLTNDSLCGQQTDPTNFCLIAYALAVLAIPVFDTVRVMFGRISRGESPFYPDKTHLHHAFIDYGFHHLETSLMEIILNMMIIGVWWVFYKSHFSEQWQLYSVIVASLGVCFGLYWMLGRRKRIAQKVKEMYGISMDEYEALTDEERKKLKKIDKR
jgi:UDP-N-acetylmuramyl pentapeptide phosphotransferase/UDP-N-acetylglucosamine-1-phosphate transferase